MIMPELKHVAHFCHCQAASIQQRGSRHHQLQVLAESHPSPPPQQTEGKMEKAVKDHLTLPFSVNLRGRSQARKRRYQFPVTQVNQREGTSKRKGAERSDVKRPSSVHPCL